MDHTRVVPGLVAGDLGFLLDDDDRELGPLFEEPMRRRQPDDSGPDDDDVATVGHDHLSSGCLRPMVLHGR
jgi:hypothetical protein